MLLLFVLGTGADALDPLTEGSQVELAEPVRRFTIPEHDHFPGLTEVAGLTGVSPEAGPAARGDRSQNCLR